REDVDFAFRFGGDEFAMVLFADYPQACNKATQVLRLMENKVSIGISTVNPSTPDGLTVEEFIHDADNALYEAKNAGRGRAVVALCALPDNGNCQFPCPNTSPHELQLVADRNP
ncbi:MAG: diguanylate cyclase, partial [Sulfuricella sp.]